MVPSPVKSMCKQLLFKAKVYRLSLLFERFFVLPYHMITDKPNGFYPETAASHFERQIAFLVKNYRVMPLDEIMERSQKGESLRGCVAITFDDGFKDNFEKAYPILKKYQVPATIFVTTGCVESGIAPWFIKLRYMFMKTGTTYLELAADRLITAPLRTREEKYAASEKVMRYFKDCPDQQRRRLFDELSIKLAINDFRELDNLMLSWDEIREMSENGISFGAHTVRHPILTRIPLAAAEEEILQSKQTIEEKTGKQVTSFAYPFGKEAQYSPDLFTILRKLHFSCAVTTNIGSNNHHTEAYALNRWYPWELSQIL